MLGLAVQIKEILYT